MKKIYLIQLGVSAIILLTATTAYFFFFSVVSSQSVQVADIQQQIQAKSQASTRVAQAKVELARLIPEEAAVDQYFISPNDIVTFLEQLAATGKYLGTDVTVLSVSAQPGSAHGTLNLSIRILGSFDSVMRTLGSIEYGPYDTRTTSVTLSTSAPSASPSGASNAATSTWEADVIVTIGTQTAAMTAVSPAPAPPVATSTAPGVSPFVATSTANMPLSANPTVIGTLATTTTAATATDAAASTSTTP